MTGIAQGLARVICAAAALTAVTPPAATPPAPPLAPAALPREAPSTAVVGRPWSIQATPPPAPSPSPEPPAMPAPADAAALLPKGGNGLVVPVRGVRPEELSDTFTAARGEGRTHDAIDIPAPKGTPVVAAADGTVVKKFESERGGVTLYVLLPDRRTLHYYAHLDRYADGIAEGRAVRRGDVLAYVGDTGNAGAGNSHLHFEVSTTTDPGRYWGGTPQNPYPLLAPSPPEAPVRPTP